MEKQIKILIFVFILSSFYVIACSDDTDNGGDSEPDENGDGNTDGGQLEQMVPLGKGKVGWAYIAASSLDESG